MSLKFKNDEEKRQYLSLVARTCAELFVASNYPHREFNFPFDGVPEQLAYPILELHMRMPSPHCLPTLLKPPVGHIPTGEALMSIFSNCPAIENISLRPEFQRYGFLNALMKELARLGIHYVNISNIENKDLAKHYLVLSRQSESGVELTSGENTVGPNFCYPTFSINLRERFRA